MIIINKKISNKNLIYNLILIFILTFGALYFVLRGQDKAELILVMSSVNKIYLFFGIILSLGFVLGEAINTKILLRIFDYDYSIFRTLKYAFTGFFFSSITPSATGGQPMQIYEMKKDNIEAYHSSLLLLIELMIYQIATVLYGSIGFIWAGTNNFFDGKFVIYMVVSGLLLNIVGICFINLCIFNPKTSYKLARGVEKVVNKLPMDKEKKEKIISSLEEQIYEYNNCAKYIKKNYMTLFKVLIVTILQMGSLFSISFIIYLALGQTGRSFVEVILIQSLIYVGSSFIPLPGSVGVSESNFLSMFKKVYGESLLSGALLLTRGISFYLLLIISMVILIMYKIKDYRKKSLMI